jgi:hypothetical protein
MQKVDGIRPLKLLLLALRATRLLVFSHVVDGKDPVKKLLEMFSTCRGRGRREIDGGSSRRLPPRRLKLTSRRTMLPEDMTSNGRPPLRELPDKLRRSMRLRLPRDGEMRPSRPLDARETSATSPSALQVMPSHVQQSVPFRHDAARPPPSRESPARNWSRELSSCSEHELDRERSSARARVNDVGTANLLMPWFLRGEFMFVVVVVSMCDGIADLLR